MSNLKIEIEQLCKHPAGSRKLVFRNTVSFNENVTYPFSNVITTFKQFNPDKDLCFTFTII